MNKILIYGCYDSFNLGDDAMMVSIKRYLEKNNKEVFFYTSMNERHNYFEKNLDKVEYVNYDIYSKYKNIILKKIDLGLKYIKSILFKNTYIEKYDSIIFMGGGYINSLWPNHIKKALYISLLAKRNKCKLYFTGQTVGPYKSWIDKIKAKLIYSMGNRVIVREKFSKNLMNELSVKNCIYGVDDFYLYDFIEKNERIIDEKYFILNIKDFFGYEEGIEKCFKLAEELQKITNYKIILLPFGKGKSHNDYKISQKLSERLKKNNISNSIFDISDMNEIGNLFKNAEFTLGMAYHSIVMSLYFNTVAIGIYNGGYYNNKILGILNHYKLEQFCYDFKELYNRDIHEISKEILQKVKKSNKIEIKEITENMKKKSKDEWKKIVNGR